MKKNKSSKIVCIVCSKKKSEHLYKTKDRMFNIAGTFQLYKCQKCNLGYLDPQPSQRTLKKHYPTTKYYAYTKKKQKRTLEKLRDYLIQHYYNPTILVKILTTVIKNVPAMPSYKKNGKVLDLGCGTGETLLQLEKLGWKVYGIDIDKKALQIAKQAGLKNVRYGTYETLNKYPDNFFDCIRLYHVVEHLDNPSLFLSLARKKLKKNGELVMGTPNLESVVAKTFKSYWYNLDSPRHLYLFAPKNLHMILKKNKYKNAQVDFCSAGGLPGSIQYVLNDKFNTKLSSLHKFPKILIFYPIEWILDKLRVGDIFTIRAYK